ncbi:MAG: amidase, partial [Gammaproteobacteria bacterium]|nr:amidase [Gammaproteobacteria bacterium]
QIKRVNGDVNAFVLIGDDDDLMEQAKASEKRWAQGIPMGALDGVPVTIKDWYNIPQWPTRFGSLISDDAPQTEFSPATARLSEAGAIFIGKTTLPEFGHKGVTDSPLSGVTRNPWDRAKTSGGSSGGAAVASAMGMGYLHLGSDAGGSIRIPASFCGVFGMKPSPGLVPHWPASLVSSLSSTGPIAQNVCDAALMLDVISKPDRRDFNAVPYQKHDFFRNITKLPKGLRVAYIPILNGELVDEEVSKSVAGVARHMEGFAQVDKITLNIPDLEDVFGKHWTVAAHKMIENTSMDMHAKMDPSFLEWAERGKAVSLSAYLDAETARMDIGHQLRALFEKYDVLIMPTIPLTAFDADWNAPIDPKTGQEKLYWTPFTFPANLAKLPASSVPCGMTSAGLPIGVQVVGDYMQDLTVMQVSYVLERVLAFKPYL